MEDIREYLKRAPLLFDGGMGTYFSAQSGAECELANLTEPDGILRVHREYLAAGARAIKSNTFGLARMAAEGDARWREALAAGWSLAKQAANEAGAWVFADIGPAGAAEESVQREAYRVVVEAFLAAGARHFLFETMSSDAALPETAALIREKCPDAFILVSFAVLPDGYTREGVYYRTLLQRAAQLGYADAAGFNCLSAPGALRKLMRDAAGSALPLSAMPNAGYPVVARGRVSYAGHPTYFVQEQAALVQQGVRILGGCCGTTPAHIAALRDALAAVDPAQWAAAPKQPDAPADAPAQAPEGDAFLRRLAAGETVIAVELDTPKTAELEAYMEGARRLQAAGADAITIADCPIARARVDSCLAACKVRRELGLVAMPHMTCRDRNINAAKALLLGLYAEGVREVLAITGDPIPTAERDEVKSVYQFNSRKMAQYIHSLAGRDLPAPLTVFGALNLNARNFDVELRRAEEKLENGMIGFLTQPVLSASALENLKTARARLGSRARILAGIIPVVSQRNAIFMENEVNGIHVAQKIIDLYAGKDRAEGEALGVTVSVEIAKAVRPYADGFYLMTPFNRVGLMEKLIARLRTEVIDEKSC